MLKISYSFLIIVTPGYGTRHEHRLHSLKVRSDIAFFESASFQICKVRFVVAPVLQISRASISW